MKYNYIDLFSGCGGFHKGLQEAGFQFGWTGFSEIDKYAKKVYQKHFPESEDLGDVRTINTDKLPKINLITFGFPCQDLSVAGKRAGLDGLRSGLFFEALRIVRATKPDIFIFENVKGPLTKNKPWFRTTLQEIADIGLYECEWQLLNTRWFLPQNRERIYLIGYFRGRSRPKVFPFREGDADIDKGRKKHEGRVWAVGLDSNYYKGADGKRQLIQIGVVGKDSEATRVYSPDGCARTIKNGGGMGAKTGLYQINPNKKSGGKQPYQQDRIYAKEGLSPALNASLSDMYKTNSREGIRRLTPLECERLQGFPDGWTEEVSDTQRYKLMGNAVSVPVVKAIGERLKEKEGLQDV